MAEPTSRAEYERRFMSNSRAEGFGLEVAQVMPCPFCAAPNWARWTIADLALTDYATMREERRCSECGRSARFVITRDAGGVRSEMVQTGGPDPAEWLRPWPRREE